MTYLRIRQTSLRNECGIFFILTLAVSVINIQVLSTLNIDVKTIKTFTNNNINTIYRLWNLFG